MARPDSHTGPAAFMADFMAEPFQPTLADPQKGASSSAGQTTIRAVKSSTAPTVPAGQEKDEDMYNPYNVHSERTPSSSISPSYLTRKNSELVSPHDSVSNYDETERRAASHSSDPNWIHQDPYASDNYYPQRNLNPYDEDEQDQYYGRHYQDSTAELPLVHFAGKPGEWQPEQDRQQDRGLYDAPQPDLEQAKYPPPLLADEKRLSSADASSGKRPSAWLRIWRDTTPIDQRIENHKRGIGVQNRAWSCWILSLAMLVVFIVECQQNWKYQGSPIAIKPIFNPMIGPTSNVLIHTGARFTPCMKDVPGVTEQAFASLENTENPPTSTSTLAEICGFGGFGPDGPDQAFRFVLPIFLHAGIIHILLNLAVQMTTSAQVEREMGTPRFLVVYFCAGIFGFILGGNFSLVGQPSVGASGAIFGTHASAFVDLIAHWSIEYRPKRKLIFLLIELVLGVALGFVPGIDNFAHLGGFAMGLLLSIILYPAIHQTKKHRLVFYGLRAVAIPGVVVLFVVLGRNFYTSDPNAACSWCRYLSCWPSESNNRCRGTGLTTTNTSATSGNSSTGFSLLFGLLGMLL